MRAARLAEAGLLRPGGLAAPTDFEIERDGLAAGGALPAGVVGLLGLIGFVGGGRGGREAQFGLALGAEVGVAVEAVAALTALARRRRRPQFRRIGAG